MSAPSYVFNSCIISRVFVKFVRFESVPTITRFKFPAVCAAVYTVPSPLSATSAASQSCPGQRRAPPSPFPGRQPEICFPTVTEKRISRALANILQPFRIAPIGANTAALLALFVDFLHASLGGRRFIRGELVSGLASLGTEQKPNGNGNAFPKRLKRTQLHPISQGRLLHETNFFCFALLCNSFELSYPSISISKIKMAQSGPQSSLTVSWTRRVTPANPDRFAVGTARQEGFGRYRGTPISVMARRFGTKFHILPLTMKYSFCFIPDRGINPPTRRKRTNFPDMRHPPSAEKRANTFLQTHLKWIDSENMP
jgi:hypothetical protein